MTGAPTLAVVAARTLDAVTPGAGVLEFLRLCTGLVAGGGALTLVEIGRGAGLFSDGRERPDEADRLLEGLASFDVRPRVVEAAELRTLLGMSDRLLRVADPSRRGTPDVVAVDASWLMHVPNAALVLAFEEAGQVIKM